MARLRKARPLTYEELVRQYDTGATVPSVDPYFARYAEASERARRDVPCEIDVAYGPGERQRLDLFPAEDDGAPLFIFFHGGYWRRLDKSFFSFVAAPVVRAGGAAAIVNYPLLATPPEHSDVTLDDIVASARRARAWLVRNAHRANADPKRIVAGGHSAGGQIAAMLTAEGDASALFAVSGLFDLEPVRQSHVNAWLNIDAEGAARNSPMQHLPKTKVRAVLAAGGAETDEFRRQSREFANALTAKGHDAAYLEPAEHNHFSIVLELDDDESVLSERLRSLLGRALT